LFERRPRAFELFLCQRYFQTTALAGCVGMTSAATDVMFGIALPVAMRAAPTAALLKTSVSAAAFDILVGSAFVTAASLSLSAANFGPVNGTVKVTGFSGLGLSLPSIGNSMSNFLSFSAEL